MSQQVAISHDRLVRNARIWMENRRWATLTHGGLAARHDKLKSTVLYIESNATQRLGGGFPVTEVPNILTGTVNDDLFAGLWVAGFNVLNANAVAHTVSTYAKIVVDNFPSSECLPISDPEIVKIMKNVNGVPTGEIFKLPIINNEPELGQKMLEVVTDTEHDFIGSPALFVRGVGLFVWGENITETMVRCESLENYFKFSVKKIKLAN